MNRFLYYVLWTLTISVALFLGTKIMFYFKQQAEITYNPTPQIIFATTFPVIIGLLLKLPDLWDQRHLTKWGMDWPKLIVVGVPSFYFSLGLIFVYTSVIPTLPLLSYVTSFGFPTIHTVAGIVFGYILVDSIRIPKT